VPPVDAVEEMKWFLPDVHPEGWACTDAGTYLGAVLEAYNSRAYAVCASRIVRIEDDKELRDSRVVYPGRVLIESG